MEQVEQVQIFSQTDDPETLQREMNDWLVDCDVTVVRVLQTQSGRMDTTLTITLFYVNNPED
jgi:hypothetical protein